MNYSLAEHNVKLADHTQHAHLMHTTSLERGFARIWVDPKFSHPEHLDFLSTISGDDLARLTRGPK